MRVILVHGDIITATADAIVNPANSLGVMGGGVAAAILEKGGAQIEVAAKQHGPCPVGQAYITTAGNLPFQGIIHAPTMSRPAEPIPPKQVELATMAALRKADEAGYASVALPGMGTGVGQVDVDVAAKIIYETAAMYLPDNHLATVYLYALSDELYQAFLKQEHTFS